MRTSLLQRLPLFRRTTLPQIAPAPVRPAALRHSFVPSAGLDVSTLCSGNPAVAPLVMLEGRDLPLGLHCNLTAAQSRNLAIRLLQAADRCDEVTLQRATGF